MLLLQANLNAVYLDTTMPKNNNLMKKAFLYYFLDIL